MRMANRTIEQPWLFMGGGCGTTNGVPAVSGHYARVLVPTSGGREDTALGWRCWSWISIGLHEKRGRKP